LGATRASGAGRGMVVVLEDGEVDVDVDVDVDVRAEFWTEAREEMDGIFGWCALEIDAMEPRPMLDCV
jgi:hypothetical protein